MENKVNINTKLKILFIHIPILVLIWVGIKLIIDRYKERNRIR